MNKAILCAVGLVLTSIASTSILASSEFKTEEFSFVTSKKERLNGIISRPEGGEAKSIVIIIHGSGRTNVVAGDHYRTTRSKFTSEGISVVVWDKPGCGKSEGEFDIDQPVESGAEEVLSAMNALKQAKEPGSDQIGLWGGSRGGWIAPLVINRNPSIKFWISVSGTDAYENWGYLLRSSLEIAGYSSAEIAAIHNAWLNTNRLFWTGADYESYLKVSKAFWQNETVQKLTGQTYAENEPGSLEYENDRKLYQQNQQNWMSGGNSFDEKTGLQVVVPGFDEVLESVSCPVLAIFGENDRNVDWRKTKALYESTIGLNDNPKLTVKVFENADHNLKLSKTGGYLESQTEEYWGNPTVNGYYEVMTEWLCSNGFCSK